MKNNSYDERQIYVKKRHGNNAFIMLIFVLLIRVAFKLYPSFNDATPLNEFAIIMFVPATYYIVANILTCSYFPLSYNKKTAMVSTAVSILNLMFFLIFCFQNDCFSDILKNGLNSNWIGFGLVFIWALIIIIVLIIRFIKDRKEEN